MLVSNRQLGYLIRMLYCCMGSFLGNSFPRLIQPFRDIRIPDYTVFEDTFEPGTGSGITSNLHIQMIAVPIQMVADERGARILYGSARRDDNLYLIRLSAFFTASAIA